MRTTRSLAPQQARSRESVRRLLRATIEVLGQQGLDGATIPRIAQHAGLSPGAVYRRFRDKDALMQTVILHVLQRQDEQLRTALSPETTRQIPLPVFAEQMVGTMLQSSRFYAGFLGAARRFAETQRHTAFYRDAERLERQAFDRLVDLFLVHRREVRHPDPRAAVSFALLTVMCTVRELFVVAPELRDWRDVVPADDDRLKMELTRAFLASLGVAPKRGPRHPRRSGSPGRAATPR